MERFNDNIYLLKSDSYTDNRESVYAVYYEKFNIDGQVRSFRARGQFSNSNVGYVYITPAHLWNQAIPFQGQYIQRSTQNGIFDFNINNDCINQSYVIWTQFFVSLVDLESLTLNSFNITRTYASESDELHDYFIHKEIPDPGKYYESRAYISISGEGAGDKSIEVGVADICDICGGLGVVLKKHTCPKCNGDKILKETFESKETLYSEIMSTNESQYRVGFGKVKYHEGNQGMAQTPEWWSGPTTPPTTALEYEGFENGAVFKYSAPGKDFYSIQLEANYITCLQGDTLITMADGSQKRLDSIQVGDLVLSKNKNPIKVLRLERGHYSKLYNQYVFEDGTIIKENGPHRFYNKEKGYWEKLQNWNIGDHAIKIDDTEIAMSSKEIIIETTEMFGLFTEDGSYWANNLLCGSNKANLFVLNSLNREQQRNIVLSMNKEELAKYFFEKNSLGISLKASQFLSKLIKNDDSTFGKKLYISKNGEIDVTFESDPLNF